MSALGPNDPETAKCLVWAVVDGWQRQFDALRNRTEMTDSDKSDLVWSHYTGTLDRDEKPRATIPTETEIDRLMKRAFEL